MTTRRPRNIISNTMELKLRCADFLDEGDTDRQAFDRLVKEFTGKIDPAKMALLKKDSVTSFRRGDYKQFQADRALLRESAQGAQMIAGAYRAQDGAITEAAMGLLTKAIYETLRASSGNMDADTAAKIGRTLVQFSAEQRAIKESRSEAEKKAAAEEAPTEILTPEERAARARQIMGMAR